MAAATEESALPRFSFTCPGLHGPGSKTDMQKVAFGELFSRPDKYEIPIMQRRYCWQGVVLERWWQAVLCGDRAHKEPDGRHRAGMCVFRRKGDALVLVLDGQQRLTTTALLCASLRDALLRWAQRHGGDRAAEAAAAALQRALVTDSTMDCTALATAVAALGDGELLPCSRLLPSFPDRRPFFRLLREGGAPGEAGPLAAARAYFDATAAALDGEKLVRAASRALNAVVVIVADVRTPGLRLPQVFLWLQERAVLTPGALLSNAAPGICAEAADLVRNLIIAPYAERAPAEAEAVYRAFWVPLERRFATPAALSECIVRFTAARTPADAQPTEFEKLVSSVGGRLASCGVTTVDVSGALAYARFLRLFELCVDPRLAAADTAAAVAPSTPDGKLSPLGLLQNMLCFAEAEAAVRQ
eukprot:TRINITY_DN4870_c0_g1_i1.p2 TRINITY_DN4870_c0_g1~~TRINITY_DN4870_c0_g1_i1.p2  ORF type:complete len:416 (-),score=120.01 TRINITY_DN4870_c0_g1_i1:1804-3051(-)